MDTQREYFDRLAAAFVRGKLIDRSEQQELFTKPLDELSQDELEAILELGVQHELRMHRFKRTMGLARVRKVLGVLKSIQPQSLLDIGSGRGVFLWPLLDAFPYLPVTCVDVLSYRVADIQAVHDGGIGQLSALQADVTQLPFENNAFEVVTMLEVLEHIPAASEALKEVCRVTNKFLLLSVPSKEDNNPEHIHLFDQQKLRQLLEELGIIHVTFEYVLNHMIVVARIGAHDRDP